MMELTIDREFDDLCPALTDDEERLLEQSLVADGCLHSIVVWANHDDTVLDGHNRYRLCGKNKIKFTTKALKFETREAAKAWILDQQCGRRNLTESQRALLAAKRANLLKGEKRCDLGADAPVGACSQAEAAESFGVGRRTVQRAEKVLEQGAKILQKAVESGEVNLRAAEVIAELPKDEQAKLVKKGPEAVASKVKKIKAKKSDAPKQYNDPFDPAELSGESKDALGKDAPDDLRQVFELRAGFKEQRDKLTSIKTWMTQNIKHPGAALLAGAQQRIVTDIDNADRELKFSAPHCVCIYCKNKAPKVANCNACKGKGWINESIYKAAPKGMQ